MVLIIILSSFYNCSKTEPAKPVRLFAAEEAKLNGTWYLLKIVDDTSLSRPVPPARLAYVFNNSNNQFSQSSSFGLEPGYRSGYWEVTSTGFVYIERQSHWDDYRLAIGDSIEITNDYANSRYLIQDITLILYPTDHDFPKLYFYKETGP